MKIKVLFFAQLRDVFGCDSQELEVPQGACVKEAEDLLRRLSGEALGSGLFFKKAVNETWAADTQILKPGDTLVLLPPVSGG